MPDAADSVPQQVELSPSSVELIVSGLANAVPAVGDQPQEVAGVVRLDDALLAEVQDSFSSVAWQWVDGTNAVLGTSAVVLVFSLAVNVLLLGFLFGREVFSRWRS